ncbi:hypothetical protein B0T26DRAFT_679795 [Lasiosphaeria miniovina]|uniref:Uncharacterized protein n=1 Tax=Lasiosphaeria miniovina TaxID=1954250 RepID=A0AA39ZYN3_9PEZI|nr:uncharacterized protein B0T26DRAFT_679795 [Lasiosphaeria miniovina]KAK0706063.1 hypothetical protein B0T26DRAFT_679795 [Lasiosphaeria miniovina]
MAMGNKARSSRATRQRGNQTQRLRAATKYLTSWGTHARRAALGTAGREKPKAALLNNRWFARLPNTTNSRVYENSDSHQLAQKRQTRLTLHERLDARLRPGENVVNNGRCAGPLRMRLWHPSTLHNGFDVEKTKGGREVSTLMPLSYSRPALTQMVRIGRGDRFDRLAES